MHHDHTECNHPPDPTEEIVSIYVEHLKSSTQTACRKRMKFRPVARLFAGGGVQVSLPFPFPFPLSLPLSFPSPSFFSPVLSPLPFPPLPFPSLPSPDNG